MHLFGKSNDYRNYCKVNSPMALHGLKIPSGWKLYFLANREWIQRKRANFHSPLHRFFDFLIPSSPHPFITLSPHPFLSFGTNINKAKPNMKKTTKAKMLARMVPKVPSKNPKENKPIISPNFSVTS